MLPFLPNLFYVTGGFAIALGTLHFFFPLLFDFRGAIPAEGDALRPFPLIVARYPTTRADIFGLIWIMNHIASFAILTVGLLDFFWPLWFRGAYGTLITLWIALFYFLRAGTQLYMGHRRGDWLVLAAFGALGALHVLVLV